MVSNKLKSANQLVWGPEYWTITT